MTRKATKIEKNCLGCKNTFFLLPCQVRAGRKCCSHACSKKYLWSKKNYRQHMSNAHKGYQPTNLEWLKENSKTLKHRKLLSKINSGRLPWNKGLKATYTSPLKGKQNPMISGENHYLYKKDRNQLVKSEKKHLDGRYREWMFAVKNRDRWICRITDVNCGGRLEAHHILDWKNYPELRYEINNGITLCHAHHPRGRTKEAELSPYFTKLVAEMK